MAGTTRVLEVADEAAQTALGARLGAACRPPLRVYLRGPLGAGKTTLVRGLLRGLGHAGAVRSPTYTLLEVYDTPAGAACHLDLYRLDRPAELEDLGARDYLDGDYCCFVEWPERGSGVLPPADVDVEMELAGTGRRLHLTARTPRGERLLEGLA